LKNDVKQRQQQKRYSKTPFVHVMIWKLSYDLGFPCSCSAFGVGLFWF